MTRPITAIAADLVATYDSPVATMAVAAAIHRLIDELRDALAQQPTTRPDDLHVTKLPVTHGPDAEWVTTTQRPATTRDRLAQVLSDHAIVPEQEGFHSWRCGHPDRYPGYCHCVPDLLDALVLAAAPDLSHDAEVARLREALMRLAGLADDGNCWCRSWEHGNEHTRACLNARAALAPTTPAEDAR